MRVLVIFIGVWLWSGMILITLNPFFAFPHTGRELLLLWAPVVFVVLPVVAGVVKYQWAKLYWVSFAPLLMAGSNFVANHFKSAFTEKSSSDCLVCDMAVLLIWVVLGTIRFLRWRYAPSWQRQNAQSQSQVPNPDGRSFAWLFGLRNRSSVSAECPAAVIRSIRRSGLGMLCIPGWVALSVLAIFAFRDVYSNGFTWGAVCGNGFGERHRALQVKEVRRMFTETLPATIDISEFSCGGFQDYSVSFELKMSKKDAIILLSDLNKSFMKPYDPAFVKIDKKKEAEIYPDRTVTKFLLPGTLMHIYYRDISVHIPTDSKAESRITFSGGNW